MHAPQKIDTEEAETLARGGILGHHERRGADGPLHRHLGPEAGDDSPGGGHPPGFFAAILDYVVSDEPLSIAARQPNWTSEPERIMARPLALSPSEFE